MSKTITTKKGSELPLMNLKGKDYLMVAYRLQWLSDDYPNYVIDTQALELTADMAVYKATVTLLDEKGQMVRRAQATKSETKSDFKDFIEKAETAAIGRALAMLGFGTQHAIADLDEGNRLADSPLEKATSGSAFTKAKIITAKTTSAVIPVEKTLTDDRDDQESVVETKKPVSFSARARLKRSAE